MDLSIRLSEIYKLIDYDTNVGDIGSDHGQLIIKLAQEKKCPKLFCNDNKSGPFKILKKNIDSYSFDNVTVSLSSGISELPSYVETVVIAGMGGELINEIITSNLDKLQNVKCLILQPNTCVKEVRKVITDLGFYIEDESIVYEKHYYEIIKFYKGNKSYDELDYEFGPILRKQKSSVFTNKNADLILKLKSILEKNISEEKREQIIKQIERIESL